VWLLEPSNLRVTGNRITVTGSGYGVYVEQTLAASTGTVVVTDNTITSTGPGAALAGIWLFELGRGAVTVANNLVTGPFKGAPVIVDSASAAGVTFPLGDNALVNTEPGKPSVWGGQSNSNPAITGVVANAPRCWCARRAGGALVMGGAARGHRCGARPSACRLARTGARAGKSPTLALGPTAQVGRRRRSRRRPHARLHCRRRRNFPGRVPRLFCDCRQPSPRADQQARRHGRAGL
jgi:hypothetical protein